MKTFRFPLDRALHIRRTQHEVEQAKLQKLIREREQIALRTNAVRAEAANIRRTLSLQPMLAAGEVSTMPDYQRGAAQKLVKLENQKQGLSKCILDQQRLTLEAERKVKLLERLRSQRFEEWNSEMEKEQENFAADAYLARWASLSAQPVAPQTPHAPASPSTAAPRR
jgi:flagellar export protein FliJ